MTTRCGLCGHDYDLAGRRSLLCPECLRRIGVSARVDVAPGGGQTELAASNERVCWQCRRSYDKNAVGGGHLCPTCLKRGGDEALRDRFRSIR
jgi:DNA-directed RNA polymerase subunit RPC12/RpoP